MTEELDIDWQELEIAFKSPAAGAPPRLARSRGEPAVEI